MKVKLQGFRSHTDSEYNFSDGQLILIKGHSGCGKSTILQGISWCLYGKLSNVINNNDPNLKCAVTIKINNYTIYRQKKPSVLKLIIKGTKKIFEDDDAQMIINQYFGPLNLWTATSYIEQSSRCELMSGKNSDKIDILNNISFNGDEPDKYIDKIDEKLKNTKINHKFFEESYSKDNFKFIEELKIKPANFKKILSDEQLIEYENELIRCQKLKPLIESQKLIQQEKIGKYKLLSTNYEHNKQRLLFLPIITKEHLNDNQILSDELKSQMIIENKTIENWKVLKLEKDKRNKFLQEYNLFIKSFNYNDNYLNNPYEEKDIWITSDIEKKRKLNKDNFDKYFINEGIYSEKDILNLCDKYRYELDNVSKIEHIRKYFFRIDSLTDKITKIKAELENLESESTQLFNYIKQLEDYEQTLESQRKELPLQKVLIDDINDKTIQYQLLIKKKEELTKSIKDLTFKKETLNKELNKKVINEIKINKCLKCPSCDAELQFVKEQLVKFNIDVQIKIDEENRIKENLLREQNIKEEIIILDQEIATNNTEIKELVSKLNDTLEQLNNVKEQYNQILKKDKVFETALQSSLKEKYQCNNKYNQSNFIKKERENQLLDNSNQIKNLYKELSINDENDSELRTLIQSHVPDAINKLELVNKVLRTIEYVEEPLVKSEEIKKMVDYKKKSAQLALLEIEFEKGIELDKIIIDDQSFIKIQNNIKILSQKMEQNKIKYQKDMELYTLYHELIKQNELYETQINNLLLEIDDKLDETHNICLANIEWYSFEIEESRYAKLISDKHYLLEDRKIEVDVMFKEILYLEELKSLAIEVECKQLKETVKTINVLMDDIFSYIFDEPISVKLLLHKELKDKRIKQQVNLEIHYKGTAFNTGALSGGECDRISLGVMLALNQVSSSPILLLDETLSSLDGNLRELCLKTIRNSSKGLKTVLCINHEDVEGLYDKVVNIV